MGTTVVSRLEYGFHMFVRNILLDSPRPLLAFNGSPEHTRTIAVFSNRVCYSVGSCEQCPAQRLPGAFYGQSICRMVHAFALKAELEDFFGPGSPPSSSCFVLRPTSRSAVLSSCLTVPACPDSDGCGLDRACAVSRRGLLVSHDFKDLLGFDATP